jgi:hypothetical protein
MSSTVRWIRSLLGLRPPLSPAQQQAFEVIRSVDAGGVPLHPARVNHIARSLGLPVSKAEPVGATVERLRAHLKAEHH